MKEVYENRAMHIELKKKMADEKGWLKNNEKVTIETELQRQQREHEEKMMRDAAYRKQYQGDVLRQIGERDRGYRREVQEKMYEERAAKLAELNYTRKIDDQKQNNTAYLQQMRNMLPY